MGIDAEALAEVDVIISMMPKEDYIKKVNTIKGISTITDNRRSLFKELY